MARVPDGMVVLEPVVEDYLLSDPWEHVQGAAPSYAPDYDLLGRLLTVPVRAAQASETGVFAKATDLWLSMELRRAGFTDHETWPRPRAPRVLPSDLAALVEALPQRVRGAPGFRLRDEVARRIVETAKVTPVDATVLGRAYEKQVDVCISRWKTGPEVLISTKTQVSSFGKNLPNRFEEALGDAANLRARHPLAAMGYLFVQRSTVLTEEPDAFERTKDMVRKLRSEAPDRPGYTATGLCLVEWDDDAQDPTVRVRLEDVPEDIQPGQFLSRIVRQVLEATPVSYHTRVRARCERRDIEVEDETE